MKIRFSKRGFSYLLFRLRNFSAVEGFRKLRPNPVAEACDVLKQADTVSCVGALQALDGLPEGRCTFMSAYRRDGVGIQAFVRICVMFLSQQVDAAYLHLPFLEVQHQFNDPIGRSVSRLDWAKRWEAFLNLGQDEYSISDLARRIGLRSFAEKMVDENSHFGKVGVPSRLALADFLQGDVNCNVRVRDINIFDLRFFREAVDPGLAFDSAFVERLQAKFDANGYVPSQWLYDDQYFEVAVHVRRGDVWEAYKAGDQRWGERVRFMSEDYYVNLLHRLLLLSTASSRPLRLHIFSDGQPTDFPQFTFVGDRVAYLDLACGVRIENIQFHLSQNSLDALYHLAKAPVVVPSKSSFSFLAVLLGRSRPS